MLVLTCLFSIKNTLILTSLFYQCTYFFRQSGLIFHTVERCRYISRADTLSMQIPNLLRQYALGVLFFYKHGGLTCTQIQGPLRCCVCEVLNIHLRIDALTCRYSNADTIKSDTILKELTLLNDQCAYFLQIQIQLHIPC